MPMNPDKWEIAHMASRIAAGLAPRFQLQTDEDKFVEMAVFLAQLIVNRVDEVAERPGPPGPHSQSGIGTEPLEAQQNQLPPAPTVTTTTTFFPPPPGVN